MIVSIDIGTSYTSMSMLNTEGKPVPVAIGEDGTSWGNKYSMPTAIFVEDDGTVLVGQPAMKNQLKNPMCFCKEFKRDFGDAIPKILGDRTFRVEELYTELLLHLKDCVKKFTDEQIEKVYLTHPATYGKDKKEKMLAAAKAAGMFNVELVEEPTAAAMDQCAEGNVKEGELLLIFDFGGGTFDAALIRRQKGKFFSVGDPVGIERCGGSDMDRYIYQHMKESILAQIPQMPPITPMFESFVGERAIQVKHQLSSAQSATDYIPMGFTAISYSLTRDTFEQKIAPMVKETIAVCEQLLEHEGLRKSDVSSIIMVGGTSRVPLVQRMVKAFAQKIPVHMASDLELTVVQGALNYYRYQTKADPDALYRKAKEIIDQDGYTPESIELLKQASASDHVRAIVDLADSNEMDSAASAQLYLRGAELGDAYCQCQIAECYDTGEGVEADEAEAARWYLAAAEKGDAEAQFQIGCCYDFGTGVAENVAEAVRWFRAAAEQGHSFAQHNLGCCYEDGDGVPKDEKEAVRLYRLAAEQDNQFAQYRLGRAYAAGLGGLPKDKAYALKWLTLAVENGDMDAQDFIDNDLDVYFMLAGEQEASVSFSPSCPEGFYMVVLKRKSNGEYLAATNESKLPVVSHLYVYTQNHSNTPMLSTDDITVQRIQTSDVTLLQRQPFYAVIHTSEKMEIGTVISSRKLFSGQVFTAQREDHVYIVERKTLPKLVIKRSYRFIGSARNYIVSINRERFELPMGGEISVYLNPDSSYQLRIANASLLDKQVPLLKNGAWDLFDQEMQGLPYGIEWEMDLSRDTIRILQDGKQIYP